MTYWDIACFQAARVLSSCDNVVEVRLRICLVIGFSACPTVAQYWYIVWCWYDDRPCWGQMQRHHDIIYNRELIAPTRPAYVVRAGVEVYGVVGMHDLSIWYSRMFISARAQQHCCMLSMPPLLCLGHPYGKRQFGVFA